MASSVQNKFNSANVNANSKVSVTLIPNHDSGTTEKGKDAVKTYHSFFQASYRFLGSAEGIFRFGQFMDRAPKWINAMRQTYGMDKVAALDELSGKGFTAWTWGTTFPRIFCITKEAIEADQEARDALSDGSTPAQAAHKAMKSVRDTTDAVSMVCWGVSMLSSLVPQGAALSRSFATTAEGATLVHDVASFEINARNLKHAYTTELKGATPEIKEILSQTKTYNWIALAKDVASIAGGVLGLIFIATGVAVVPGVVFVTLSLSSTVFAIMRKLYEEQMDCRYINFLDKKHVTLVSA